MCENLFDNENDDLNVSIRYIIRFITKTNEQNDYGQGGWMEIQTILEFTIYGHKFSVSWILLI